MADCCTDGSAPSTPQPDNFLFHAKPVNTRMVQEHERDIGDLQSDRDQWRDRARPPPPGGQLPGKNALC
jgi:hypothetical protein